MEHMQDNQTETIGIIAGSGQFPFMVAREAKQNGFRVVVCGFYEHTDEALVGEVDAFLFVHLGQLSKMIKFFKEHSVTRACLAGAVNKPRALSLRPDFRTAKIIFKLKGKGDDALLRAVVEEVESEGIKVTQAAALVPNLIAPEGVYTKKQPTEEDWASINFGWNMAKELGRFDIGQCIIVKRQMVVAVEAIEGTDATLTRAGELVGKGCVAVKCVKNGQDERVDLPALGIKTIEILAQYGYSCLVLEAGKTLFFDREHAIAIANKANISIIALPSSYVVS